MSFGFDVFAVLVLGGFYLASRSSKGRRGTTRQPPQRSTERPAHIAKPAWMVERDQRAIAEGKRGEALVQQSLHQLQMPALHDIMLEDDHGPTQVDHLVKMPWGVAVLETKHYSGFIFGNPSGETWTQRFYRSDRSDEYYEYNFRNPVRQNYRHLKAVEHVLRGSGILARSFVVFSGNARIGDTVKDYVIPLAELGEKIRAADMPRANAANLEIAWSRLRQVSVRAEGRRAEHLIMVKARSSQQPGSAA